MVGDNVYNSKGVLLSTGIFDGVEISLDDIENPESKGFIPDKFGGKDNPYDYASIFLRGSCELFALALHQLKGYAGLILCNSEGREIHYFCTEQKNGIVYFIDVRGITCDIEELVSEFVEDEYSLKEYEFPKDDSLSYMDQYGLRFAKWIIEEEDWYNLT